MRQIKAQDPSKTYGKCIFYLKSQGESDAERVLECCSLFSQDCKWNTYLCVHIFEFL